MRKYYSRTECAERLGVHPQTISNYISNGLISVYRPRNMRSKMVYIDKESFDNFLATQFETIRAKELSVKYYEEQLEERIAELKAKEDSLRIAISCTGALRTMISNGLVDCLFRAALSNSDPPLKEREYEIIQNLMNGCTINEIAAIHSISRERVRQIVVRISRLMSHTLYDSKNVSEEIRRLTEQNIVLKGVNKELRNEITRYNRLLKVKTPVDEHTKSQNWQLIRLTDCNVSTRALNCIRHSHTDISTVYDLLKITEQELLCIPHLGRKSLTELSDFMESLGLRIGQLAGEKS